MLNRKFADLRHAPRLDPRLLRYDPTTSPQAILRLGPGCRRKVKGGIVLAEPGFTWALHFYPGRWYAVTAVFDDRRALVGHHIDLCLPPEETGGVLSFLDLKLDLVLPVLGQATWVDQDHFALEIEAGTISRGWREQVETTAAWIDREVALDRFPPAPTREFPTVAV